MSTGKQPISQSWPSAHRNSILVALPRTDFAVEGFACAYGPKPMESITLSIR